MGVAPPTEREVSLPSGKVVVSTHNVGVMDANGGLLPHVRYQVVGMVDSPGAGRTLGPGESVWRVLDRKTGRFITEASTRDEAIADATQRVHADATGAEQKPALSHIYAPLEIAHPEVFDLFGHIIDASGYDTCSNASKMIIHGYFNDLRTIEPDIAQKVMNLGLNGMYFGEGQVPELDNMQYLRGEHPPEAPEGMTWDDEELVGCYSGNGISGQIIVAAPKSMADKGFNQIYSPILHEFGHALGHMLGHNNDRALIAAHIRLYNRLPRYLKQNGPGTLAGRKELLADGVAAVLKDPVAAATEYDQDFVLFIQNVVLKGERVISESPKFPRPPGSRP